MSMVLFFAQRLGGCTCSRLIRRRMGPSPIQARGMLGAEDTNLCASQPAGDVKQGGGLLDAFTLALTPCETQGPPRVSVQPWVGASTHLRKMRANSAVAQGTTRTQSDTLSHRPESTQK
jgi:hypothetical protein